MKYLLLLINLFLLLIYVIAQEDENENRKKPFEHIIEKIKERVDFNNWPNKQGKIREGINLLNIDLLKRFPELKKYDIERSYAHIIVKSPDKEDKYMNIYVRTYLNNSSAHEELVFSWTARSSQYFPIIKELNVGDICFGGKGDVEFIRNNIIVKIRSEKQLEELVYPIAKLIDDELVKKNEYNSMAEIAPEIIKFEVEKTIIKKGEEIKIFVSSKLKSGKQLMVMDLTAKNYPWGLSVSKITEDKTSVEYSYKAELVGKEEFKLEVRDDNGSFSIKKTEIEVY